MMEQEESQAKPSAKRARDPEEDASGADSSSDDDFGPLLPSSAPKKKKRKLPHENLYVAALPSSVRYSKSLMHREQLAYVLVTPLTDFLITTSIDGVVKFWKKVNADIEFVKEFKAHKDQIRSLSVSADGRSLATAGADKTVKIFDVVTFDLLSALNLEFSPSCVCWVHPRGAPMPLLAVSAAESSEICVFDGSNLRLVHKLKSLHRAPVLSMAFNNLHNCVVSVDEGGMLEYWSPGNNYDKPSSVFSMKSATDLFEFKKVSFDAQKIKIAALTRPQFKSVPTSLTMSPTGKQFATFSLPDRKVRIFDFASGKLARTYDESLQTAADMQQAGTALRLEDSEFQRRLLSEQDIPQARSCVNVIFDETGFFVLYGSILGIKVVNTVTNRVVKVYAKDEPFRALNLALYQGQPDKKDVLTTAMATSDNPLLQEAEARDAMLVATGFGKVRFFVFTNTEDISRSRDIQNEKFQSLKKELDNPKRKQISDQAVIHTTFGDIFIRLFPDVAPKAVENFVTHARNGYYNGVIFHRVIRKFMIQTGDPLGDGTGGESIWGKEFADEISALRHDKPYTVSMANAGPNTNGSQFFVTTEKAVSFFVGV